MVIKEPHAETMRCGNVLYLDCFSDTVLVADTALQRYMIPLGATG